MSGEQRPASYPQASAEQTAMIDIYQRLGRAEDLHTQVARLDERINAQVTRLDKDIQELQKFKEAWVKRLFWTPLTLLTLFVTAIVGFTIRNWQDLWPLIIK